MKKFGIVAMLVALMLCGLAGWRATHPALGIFVAPGATDLQITPVGWGTWQIRYRAQGNPTTWYSDIAERLERQRWRTADRAEYGALSRTYSRAISLGVGELWEWATLTFDPLKPNEAHITVRQWIALPNWRIIDGQAAGEHLAGSRSPSLRAGTNAEAQGQGIWAVLLARNPV